MKQKSSNSSITPLTRSVSQNRNQNNQLGVPKSTKQFKILEELLLDNNNSESLIFETKREAIESLDINNNNYNQYVNSCSSRLKGDLKLSLIVPALKSINFKRKDF